MKRCTPWCFLLVFLLIISLISGCGNPPPPGAGNPPPPSRGELVRGETLPGKLLFVRDGVIWLWTGNEAGALIGNGKQRQPAWSPDGETIAYIEHGESYTDVMLADARGKHLYQLTFYGSDQQLQSLERIYETMWAFYPTWMPDGSRLTIVSQYSPPYGSPAIEYNLTLFHLATDGSGNRQQIYANSSAHCGPMAYRPVGLSEQAPAILAFVQSGIYAEGYPQIYLLDLETETATTFPGAPPYSYDPAFSPDGKWLAFAARSGEETDLWVVPGFPSEGGPPVPVRLTSMGRARAPTFSPDGTLLAFLAIPPGKGGFELWIAPVSTNELGILTIGNPQQISQDMFIDADSGLSWAP